LAYRLYFRDQELGETTTAGITLLKEWLPKMGHQVVEDTDYRLHIDSCLTGKQIVIAIPAEFLIRGNEDRKTDWSYSVIRKIQQKLEQVAANLKMGVQGSPIREKNDLVIGWRFRPQAGASVIKQSLLSYLFHPQLAPAIRDEIQKSSSRTLYIKLELYPLTFKPCLALEWGAEEELPDASKLADGIVQGIARYFTRRPETVPWMADAPPCQSCKEPTDTVPAAETTESIDNLQHSGTIFPSFSIAGRKKPQSLPQEVLPPGMRDNSSKTTKTHSFP